MRFSRWDQKFSTRISNELLTELALWHLHQAPRDPLNLTAMIMDGDYRGLCMAELSYSELTVREALHYRQVLALFQKRADLAIGENPRANAEKTFEAAESLCRETNALFRNWSSGSVQLLPDVERVFQNAQRKIARVLGKVPRYEELNPRFGPGATTQVKKERASARRKLAQKFACSEDMLGAVVSVLKMMPAWVLNQEAPERVTVSCARLSFVPKSAKTHRAIAVEPMLNSMFQLAIGDLIASRLRRVGVDITDQTRNQSLAKVGSVDGSLATIDLSSASDTIATELVAHLLPLDWFSLLKTFRTGKLETRKGVIVLQKFSTMGNGFTFPLETLIFWALAKASQEISGCEGEVSAYGDDLIVPTGAFDLLVKSLTAAGFITNKAKSFASGPFRESCGKDYLSGTDIRPCYIKDRLLGADVFRLYNFYCRSGLQEAAELVLQWLTPEVRLWGPDGYGDGHLVTTRRSCLRPKGRKLGWSGFVFDTYSWESRFDYEVLPGDRVLPSYTVYANPIREGVADVDDSVLPIHLRRGFRSVFYDASPSTIRYSEHAWLGVQTPGRVHSRRLSIYTLY